MLHFNNINNKTYNLVKEYSQFTAFFKYFYPYFDNYLSYWIIIQLYFYFIYF